MIRIDTENDYIASKQSIDIQHTAVGGGYAYNYVPFDKSHVEGTIIFLYKNMILSHDKYA